MLLSFDSYIELLYFVSNKWHRACFSHLIMDIYNSFHNRHNASILGPLHLKYDSKNDIASMDQFPFL